MSKVHQRLRNAVQQWEWLEGQPDVSDAQRKRSAEQILDVLLCLTDGVENFPEVRHSVRHSPDWLAHFRHWWRVIRPYVLAELTLEAEWVDARA
ncbi:MAG: hypothetical protein NZ556_09680 [Fimbriimonadales bacterium]|nr:hypothetical protein [Fimbriimonadales bacterium]